MSLNTVARNAFVVGSLALLSWALPYFANAELAQSVSCTSPLLQESTSLWLSNGGNNWVPPLSLTYNNKVVLLYRPPLTFSSTVNFIDGYSPNCVLAGNDVMGAITVLSFCRPNVIEAYVNISPNISTPLLCKVDSNVYNRIYTEALTAGTKLGGSIYYNVDFVADANMFSTAFDFQNYAVMTAAYAAVFLYENSKDANGTTYRFGRYWGAGLRINSIKYLTTPIWTPGANVTSDLFPALQGIETGNGTQQPTCQFGVYMMNNDSTSSTKGFIRTPIAPVNKYNLAVYQGGFSDRMYSRMLDRFGNYISLLMRAFGVSYDYPANSTWMPAPTSEQLQTLMNSLNQIQCYYVGIAPESEVPVIQYNASDVYTNTSITAIYDPYYNAASISISPTSEPTTSTSSTTGSTTRTSAFFNINPASRFGSKLAMGAALTAAVAEILQLVF